MSAAPTLPQEQFNFKFQLQKYRSSSLKWELVPGVTTNTLIRIKYHFNFGVSGNIFTFKTVLYTCIWQFTNRKKLLCLTLMVKTQTTTHTSLSCVAIWKQFISPSGQNLKSLYGLHILDCSKFVLLVFWLLHEPPDNNKKSGFALVLIMKVFSKKVQVTLIINCSPSFNPSERSYFNRLRYNILSVLLVYLKITSK